jgi:diaminopimelate decarboxylase
MDIRQRIWEQGQQYDSFYLYDEKRIIENTHRLQQDFPLVDFLYSMKTNPAPAVVRCVCAQGFGVDAASLNEVKLAVSTGVPAAHILYSAPGKREADIQEALGKSTVIADSIAEIMKIQKIAQEKGIIVPIGIRINPDFTFTMDKGMPSKFGIDEEQVLSLISQWVQLPNIKIIGIHVHVKSQELQADVLAAYHKKMFQLAYTIRQALGYALTFVNMGSGLGIPYSRSDVPLDTVRLGRQTAVLIDAYRKKLAGTKIILETGRYAVGDSGYYVTKVLDRKESRGKTFIILQNTLNGFVRPSLNQLVRHYTDKEHPTMYEPFFTCTDAFPIDALTEEKETEMVTLAGNLCAATDVIATDMVLPKLKPGDLIVMNDAGSYAAVMTPMQFSSQEKPQQLFLRKDGTVVNAME